MTPSTARSLLAVSVVLCALVSCTGADSEPSSETPPSGQTAQEHTDEPDALSDLAASASEQATRMAAQLLVVNTTPRAVVLTSEDGETATTVEPGTSVTLDSEQFCAWLPLTANTPGGRVIDEYTEPCRGGIWTIARH